MNLGWGELVVIFAIVLLIVGARRLPELGRSIGQAVREFQDGLRARPGSPNHEGRSGGKKHDDDQPSEKQ
jgi:sec-independent protein translocase protein TatA